MTIQYSSSYVPPTSRLSYILYDSPTRIISPSLLILIPTISFLNPSFISFSSSSLPYFTNGKYFEINPVNRYYPHPIQNLITTYFYLHPHQVIPTLVHRNPCTHPTSHRSIPLPSYIPHQQNLLLYT